MGISDIIAALLLNEDNYIELFYNGERNVILSRNSRSWKDNSDIDCRREPYYSLL